MHSQRQTHITGTHKYIHTDSKLRLTQVPTQMHVAQPSLTDTSQTSHTHTGACSLLPPSPGSSCCVRFSTSPGCLKPGAGFQGSLPCWENSFLFRSCHLTYVPASGFITPCPLVLYSCPRRAATHSPTPSHQGLDGMNMTPVLTWEGTGLPGTFSGSVP